MFRLRFGKSNRYDPAVAQETCHFVVVAQARSGSTFLRETLNSQPDVICHGEVFSRAWINKLVPRPGTLNYTRRDIQKLLPSRDADPTGFLVEHVLFKTVQASGFKVIYEDLLQGNLAEILAPFILDHKLQVIHLRRLNPVASLASRMRMAHFGISHSDRVRPGEASAGNKKIRISLEHLKRYIRKQNDFAARVDALFPDALQLRYETLKDDFPRLLTRLGLPEDRDFGAHLTKMTPRALSEVIENYAELAPYDHPAQPVWS